MFDEEDQEIGPVLTLVIGIAIAVSLFAIAVALSVTGVFSRPATGASSTSPSTASRAAASLPPGVATSAVKLYFALGSAALPSDAAGSLLPVVMASRADPARRIDVSGFHDPSGDRAANAELAKERALAVRDALVSAGVSADRIALQKPVEVTGTGDAEEARRVEVALR